jgi:O-methyltransferase
VFDVLGSWLDRLRIVRAATRECLGFEWLEFRRERRCRRTLVGECSMGELEHQIAAQEAMMSLMRGNHAQTVRELIAVTRACVLPQLAVSDRQFKCLCELFGTTVLEALYLIDRLGRSLDVDGDVCEFGVAQGRTSALIAATLLDKNSPKRLWLYDSFEGLPAPSEKDTLLNDIFGLGSIGAYKGHLAIPETEVIGELSKQGFPEAQVEICKGWIEESLSAGRCPAKVAFAYLDMDFYRSTADALFMLAERMPAGGSIIVDDYGFFSAGVQTAVQEIMTARPDEFELENPFGFKFAILQKR